MSANEINDRQNEAAEMRVSGVVPLREARRAFERDYILSVLEQQQWSIAGTARVLGLQRPNLYRKARQLSIPLKRNEGME